MVFPPSTDVELGVLRNIHRIATELTDLLKKSSSTLKPSPRLNSPILPLELPFPDYILAPIFTISGPTKLREQLISCFTSRIEELRSQYGLAFQRACFATLALPGKHDADLNAIRQTYETVYCRRCFPIIKAQVASVMAEISKWHCSDLRGKRPPFRAEFTPLFEMYFEYNAYPSASHRSVLASKSMMSPRQIEVWFQNHRTRAKKDGNRLNRNDSDLPLRICLERVTSGRTSEDLSGDDSGDEALDQPTTFPLDRINDQRPSHAFPTPYPSTGVDDPFQSKGKFPAPVWRRRPVTKVVPREQCSVDMDELTLEFASKLHFRDLNVKSVKPKQRRPSEPWFMSTTIKPFRAPLPSLIRSPYRPFPQACSRTSPCPPSSKFGSTFVDEFPRLSKQVPKHPSLSSRFAPSSRTPSLTSISSSQSRSTSTSSVSSNLSDAPGEFTRKRNDLELFNDFLDGIGLWRRPDSSMELPRSPSSFDFLRSTEFPTTHDYCNIFNVPLGQLLVSS